PVPRAPDRHPSLRLALVLLAVPLPAGRVLLRERRAGHRREQRPAAGGGDGEPRQPLDLVEQHPLRAPDALLRDPLPELPRRLHRDRLPHPVPALGTDHPGALPLPHVRRADLHGPGTRLRAGPDRRRDRRARHRVLELARPRRSARLLRLAGDSHPLLHLLLPGLDRDPDRQRPVPGPARHRPDVVPEMDLVADRQAFAGWAGRHRRTLVLGGLSGLLLVLPLALLMARIGLPSLLLLFCAVSGYGLTYLSGLELVVEERLLFGTV